MHDELFTIFGSIGIDNRKANKEIDKTVGKAEKAGKGITSAFKKAAVAIGGFFVAKNIFDFGASTIQAASDVEEMRNKFNVVFDGMTSAVDKWADNYADSIGRNRNVIKGYLADNQNMFVGMGMTREAGADLSEQLVTMAIDLASFNNLNEGDAVKAMSKAIMGESEAAKALGAVLNDNTRAMAQEALGYKGKFKDLTESQKMQVRYQAIVMQSTDAIGDAERSLDSYKGRQLQLNAAIGNVKESIGALIMPLGKLGIEFIGSGVNKVQAFVTKMTETGVTLDGFVDKAKKGFTIFKNVTGSAFKKTVEAAGKFQAFFNKEILPIVQNIQKEVQKRMPLIKKAFNTYIKAIIKVFKKYVELFKKHVLPTMGKLYEFIKKYILPILAKFADFLLKNLPHAINFVADFIVALIGFFEGVADVIGVVIEWVGKAIDAFLSFIEAVKELPEKIEKEFNLMKDKVIEVIDGLIDGAAQWGKNMIDMFVNGINEKIEDVKTAAGNVAQGIKDFIGFNSPTKDGPAKNSDKWMPNLIKMLVDGLDKGASKVGEATAEIAKMVDKFIGFGSGINAGAAAGYKAYGSNFIKSLADGIKGGTNSIGEAMQAIANAIDENVSRIISNLESKMNLQQSKFDLKMLQNRDLADTERGYRMQIEALTKKQNAIAKMQQETQKARNALAASQGEDSAGVLEYDQQLIDYQIERTRIFNEIEDTKKLIEELKAEKKLREAEEKKSNKGKKKSNSNYVKMWTGSGFATVHKSYVAKYKKEGYTTDLPSDEELEKYAKGAVLTKPTAFGYNPMSGKTMVAGEAGAEAIAPIETLKTYIAEAVDNQNAEVVAVLKMILAAIVSMDDDIFDKFKSALESADILNKRDLKRLVGA